ATPTTTSPRRLTSSLDVSFFYSAPPTAEIYTLSLHDALPISSPAASCTYCAPCSARNRLPSQKSLERGLTIQGYPTAAAAAVGRSEEHTSELQSRGHLVCRLLLEKKNKSDNTAHSRHLLPVSR